MGRFSRRDFLRTTGAAAALGAASTVLQSNPAAAADLHFEPEKGAKLRVLRWKRFVQGDEDQFLANTKRYTDRTGVEVRIDAENWEEVRPKAAVAANVGAGSDIIIATDDDPQQYPQQLVDLTDLADYLGQKYGGWYDVCRDFWHARRADGSLCRQGPAAAPWSIARACWLQPASTRSRRTFPAFSNCARHSRRVARRPGSPSGTRPGMPPAGPTGFCGRSAAR